MVGTVVSVYNLYENLTELLLGTFGERPAVAHLHDCPAPTMTMVGRRNRNRTLLLLSS